MRLTNYMTIISFSRRREATGDHERARDLFIDNRGKEVEFLGENGVPERGVLRDLLSDGTFVVMDYDGEEQFVKNIVAL